ncbi:ogr/Delta-like zinc finger family protein [Proteus terrae]|uniref:ogr/Delta-like zinc finger family protein n=1 Tax=Proteus terrae TaxID=1574161 RepID=UPI001F309EC4|nr:ogr/Delta-like zinc finger family protein [Proteus terrae]
MMICPVCGHAAHTRSSQQISSDTKERYNQCQNINCGATFVSHETVTRFISKPQLIERVELHENSYRQKDLILD